MTVDEFRTLALQMPEAVEASHMNHPDFRVRGKIFATLARPDEGLGMVKLTPAQQREYMRAEPDVFVPAQGAWGRQGCTYVQLELANLDTVRLALVAAWRNVAPKRLVQAQEDEA